MKSPKSEWFVLRSFRSGGRTYKVGEPFPWRQVGCSERRVSQMVANRQLCSQSDLPKASEEKEPVKAGATEGE